MWHVNLIQKAFSSPFCIGKPHSHLYIGLQILAQNVVFQYRWSLIQVALYLDVFDSARIVGMALLEVVIRAAQSNYSNNKHKIPLHIITYLIISLEPIVAPTQKFYQQ